MKPVQSIVGRLVQRIAAKCRNDSKNVFAGRPVELDAHSLKDVAGGNGTTQTPTKGW